MSELIQTTRLPSGLTIVTERMDRVETVSFGAYVATGSRNETEAENGVSHFLEHMAFKGTETRSAAAIAEEIEAVGGHINAYTAREQTAYYVKVLKEDTALAADIIGDILTHSTFEPEEMERERGVILQEIGQANDTPDDIIFDHFQEVAYPLQSLGRPILGTEEGIREMPRTTLTGYMKRHYAPPNVVVAAAGKLEHAQILELVGRHFADLPAQVPPGMETGVYQGGEFREDRDLDQVHIVSGVPLGRLFRSGLLSDAAALHRARRRHVVAAVPGNPGEARAGVFDLLVRAAVYGWRPVWYLRGHRGKRGRGTDAGHAGGTAQGADLGYRCGTGPRQGAGEGERADVAGKHRQPVRATGTANPGVRPGAVDRGDGAERSWR